MASDSASINAGEIQVLLLMAALTAHPSFCLMTSPKSDLESRSILPSPLLGHSHITILIYTAFLTLYVKKKNYVGDLKFSMQFLCSLLIQIYIWQIKASTDYPQIKSLAFITVTAGKPVSAIIPITLLPMQVPFHLRDNDSSVNHAYFTTSDSPFEFCRPKHAACVSVTTTGRSQV